MCYLYLSKAGEEIQVIYCLFMHGDITKVGTKGEMTTFFFKSHTAYFVVPF